jgi:ATP-dependent DNA helicase RecG
MARAPSESNAYSMRVTILNDEKKRAVRSCTSIAVARASLTRLRRMSNNKICNILILLMAKDLANYPSLWYSKSVSYAEMRRQVMQPDRISIPPLIQQLIERLEAKESLEVEFKSAQGGLPKSIWETISAFANTQGGWIVLGVVEKGQSVVIEGVKNAYSMLQTFADLARNSQKISHMVCGADDSSIDRLLEQDVIVLRIPAAPRKARPVYINQNPYQGTYVRRHGGDYHCNKQEVDRMMREASDVGVDSTVLAKYSFEDDIDADSLAKYRRRYQTSHPESAWNNYGDYEFLKAIKGINRDRDRNVESITVAGLLLVGKAESIRDWRTRHLIDYRVLPEADQGSERWDDRIAWEGNLFGAFEIIYPRLIQALPVPFQLKEGTRIDSTVHVVLREALVNLLVHTDYSESQSSLIFHSSKGFFFRNPGSSRVLESDLLMGDRSESTES